MRFGHTETKCTACWAVPPGGVLESQPRVRDARGGSRGCPNRRPEEVGRRSDRCATCARVVTMWRQQVERSILVATRTCQERCGHGTPRCWRWERPRQQPLRWTGGMAQRTTAKEATRSGLSGEAHAVGASHAHPSIPTASRTNESSCSFTDVAQTVSAAASSSSSFRCRLTSTSCAVVCAAATTPDAELLHALATTPRG